VALVFVVAGSLVIGFSGVLGGGKASPTPTPTPTPIQAAKKTYTTPPPMTIDPNKTYIATIVTAKGAVKINLLAKEAPRTVNNFVFLAREGFYDGLTFHRVLKDFMAQGGDPLGTGAGGPGYQFEDENQPADRSYPAGSVAMANSGPNTNGSQFFICTADYTASSGGYNLFGKVIDGIEVVKSLTLRDPEENPTFPGDVMQKVTIEEQ